MKKVIFIAKGVCTSVAVGCIISPIQYKFNVGATTVVEVMQKFWIAYVIATLCSLFYFILILLEDKF